MKLTNTFSLVAATLASAGIANAHIVALGWTSLGGGTVAFSALHWHGNHETAGALIFDGVSYPFTSVTWDAPVLSGFDGGLVNSEYATYANGTITATTSEDNWLHVTISGIGPGNHTVTADSGPGQLTEWTLDGDVSTFEFDFTGGGDSERLVSSTLRMASVSVARTVTRDVGDRLFRMRAGRPQADAPMVASAPATDAKGGMVQSSKSPIMMPASGFKNWEVYGSIFFYNEDQDSQIQATRAVTGALVTRTLHPETSMDVFGGNAGFEYRFSDRLSAGFALSAASTDLDMTTVGSADIDTLALMPYVSYYQTDMLGSADFYADALYAYGMNDYDVTRLAGAGLVTGSPDGDFHQIEVTTGLNYNTGNLIHGPYASLRWLDGSIDSYLESGLGGARIPSVDYESLATNLGYQVSYPVQVGGGVLVPQGRAAWEHEFEEDLGGNVLGLPAGQLDDDIAILGAGLGYYMTNSWNVVLDYEARLGSNNQGHYVGLKAGYEF